MAAFLDKLRNSEFTGLNRAFGRGKHSSDEYEEKGIRGGPQSKRSPKVSDSDSFAKYTLICRAIQAFFLLISVSIALAILVFQDDNDVGPSGLSGLNIFVTAQSLFLSIALFIFFFAADRWDKFNRLTRTLLQIRVGFIVEGTQTLLTFCIALANTISANVKGCKNVDDDPHADKEGYTAKLDNFCRNKRALSAFLWFAFGSWLVTLIFVFLRWRSIRKFGNSPGAFHPPDEDEDDAFDANNDYIEPDDEPYDARPTSPEPPLMPTPNRASRSQIPAKPTRPSETYYERSAGPFAGSSPAGYEPRPSYQDPFRDTSAPPRYIDPYEKIAERIRREEALNYS